MIPKLLSNYQELFGILKESPNIYLVGGAIRDTLHQRPVHDMDFVLDSDVRPIARRVADQLGGAFYMLDSQRNTARVILGGEHGAGNFTLDFARMQGKNIENDLRQRDFTVNAMAISLAMPTELIDPCGGLLDLRENSLRACLNHSISDDPVRVLRGIRISLDFGLHIDSGTQRQMHDAVGSLGNISAERLRDELFRILDGKSPAAAIRFFEYFGINSLMLPEISQMKGIAQSSPHTLDTWEHTLATLRYLEIIYHLLVDNGKKGSENLWAGALLLGLGKYKPRLQNHFKSQLENSRSRRSLLFFSALYHDCGKPLTRLVDEDGRIRFFDNEHIGARLAADRMRNLALSQDELKYAAILIENHLRPNLLSKTAGSLTRRSIYRFFRDTGEFGIDICLLSLADNLGTYNTNLNPDLWADSLGTCQALFSAWWEENPKSITPPRLINGDDIQSQFHLSPGPMIGHLLEALREAQATGEVADRDQALEFIRKQL
jgi:tRNA nucleotidyltransferase/poly(A) polymerase